MQGRWWGVGIGAFVLAAHGVCFAGEIAGKLERIDLKTVTVRSADNEPVVLKVNRQDRCKAAPFIGKWVRIEFKSDNGRPRAIVFGAPAR